MDRFHIADIIQGIKDAENIHPVFNRKADKFLDHIIRIMAVAYQILPAQQHLQAGVLHPVHADFEAAPRGLHSRKRMQVSKVAPPQTSREKKPTLSSSAATTGSMSRVRIRVAIRD